MDEFIDSTRNRIMRENLEREYGCLQTSGEQKAEISDLLKKESLLSAQETPVVQVENNNIDSFLDSMNKSFEHRDWWKLDKEIQERKLSEYCNKLCDKSEMEKITQLYFDGKLKRKFVQYNKKVAKIESIVI